MKLTALSNEVFEKVKESGKITIDQLSEALGRKPRSVNANVTDLDKKGLATRVKEKEGDKEVTYVILTDEGMGFVPSED